MAALSDSDSSIRWLGRPADGKNEIEHGSFKPVTLGKF